MNRWSSATCYWRDACNRRNSGRRIGSCRCEARWHKGHIYSWWFARRSCATPTSPRSRWGICLCRAPRSDTPRSCLSCTSTARRETAWGESRAPWAASRWWCVWCARCGSCTCSTWASRCRLWPPLPRIISDSRLISSRNSLQNNENK